MLEWIGTEQKIIVDKKFTPEILNTLTRRPSLRICSNESKVLAAKGCVYKYLPKKRSKKIL